MTLRNVPFRDAVKATARGYDVPGCNVRGAVKPCKANGGSMLMGCTVIGTVPTLLRVTDCGTLELPTLWSGKVREEALRPLFAAVFNPVPRRGRTRGLAP